LRLLSIVLAGALPSEPLAVTVSAMALAPSNTLHTRPIQQSGHTAARKKWMTFIGVLYMKIISVINHVYLALPINNWQLKNKNKYEIILQTNLITKTNHTKH
jgi:hypothetical protein